MAQVVLTDEALADLERLEEFLCLVGDPLASGLFEYVMDALQVLTHQPGIGRPVSGGFRELIILRRRSGYLAKYEYNDALERVHVLRFRHQRESGYSADEI